MKTPGPVRNPDLQPLEPNIWSWTFEGGNTITMGPIPDDPDIADDLGEWIDQIGVSLAEAMTVPGTRITVDVTTLLEAWVAGGFAEKLSYQYRMTSKGQHLDGPPEIPVAVYGRGITAPWNAKAGPCIAN